MLVNGHCNMGDERAKFKALVKSYSVNHPIV